MIFSLQLLTCLFAYIFLSSPQKISGPQGGTIKVVKNNYSQNYLCDNMFETETILQKFSFN